MVIKTGDFNNNRDRSLIKVTVSYRKGFTIAVCVVSPTISCFGPLLATDAN